MKRFRGGGGTIRENSVRIVRLVKFYWENNVNVGTVKNVHLNKRLTKRVRSSHEFRLSRIPRKKAVKKYAKLIFGDLRKDGTGTQKKIRCLSSFRQSACCSKMKGSAIYLMSQSIQGVGGWSKTNSKTVRRQQNVLEKSESALESFEGRKKIEKSVNSRVLSFI